MFCFRRSVISDWRGWRSLIRTCTWPRKSWHSIIARRKSWWARDTTPPRWTCGVSAASSASCYVGGSSSRPKAPCNRWRRGPPPPQENSTRNFFYLFFFCFLLFMEITRLHWLNSSNFLTIHDYLSSSKECLSRSRRSNILCKILERVEINTRILSFWLQLELITELLGSPTLEEMRYACEGAKSHMLRRAQKPPSLATLYNLSSQATHEAVHLLCQMLVFDPVS